MRIPGGAKSLAQGAASTTADDRRDPGQSWASQCGEGICRQQPKLVSCRRGEAGRAGGDVRSDLHVSVRGAHQRAASRSSCARAWTLYYGDSIRQQVRDVLHALGVEHACVEHRRRRRAAVRDRGARRSGGAPCRAGQRQVGAARSSSAACAVRARPPAALASLPAGQRAEVLHQRRPARARRHHSRPRRLGAPRGERCRAPAGAQRAARGRFRRGRAHGAHQSVAARTGRPGRNRSAVARPHPDPEGRDRRTGVRS